MARCQKCGTKIRKLGGNPSNGSRWGCRKCLKILKMQRKLYTINGRPC